MNGLGAGLSCLPPASEDAGEGTSLDHFAGLKNRRHERWIMKID